MIELRLLAAGYCKQLQTFVFPAEQPKKVRFYALFGLLKHPKKGYILFDTGYANHYFELTRQFPYRLYALLAPVMLQPEQTALRQLERLGIRVDEVTHIIVSHFHADHIGGLRDFAHAKMLCFRAAYDDVKYKRGLVAVKKGFLPNLLPDDFSAKCHFILDEDFIDLPKDYAPFARGVNLLGDESIWAVKLEGHAKGQMGLFVKAANEEFFLIADAAWHSRALREGILPSKATQLFIASWHDYVETFKNIEAFHQRRPDVTIVPSHCGEVYEKFICKGM
jgi:glyoxylase-like metal-dependent hydrolase (beta-lactamase superfamily II)